MKACALLMCLSLGIASAMSSGCATMVYGKKPERVEVRSTPPGAKATLRGFEKEEQASPVTVDHYASAKVLETLVTPGAIPNPTRVSNYQRYENHDVPFTVTAGLAMVFEKEGYASKVVPLSYERPGGCIAIIVVEFLLVLLPAAIDLSFDPACFNVSSLPIEATLEKVSKE